jgi:hypothetical protein
VALHLSTTLTDKVSQEDGEEGRNYFWPLENLGTRQSEIRLCENAPVRRLPRGIVQAIDESRILGIRAGTRSEHRFTGVWPVVVERRVFVRSWTLKPGGWYGTFLEDPRGTIQIDGREIRVRAVRVRSERLRDAVEDAYAAKYNTPASRKYVRGFRAARRREATIEFVPR